MVGDSGSEDAQGAEQVRKAGRIFSKILNSIVPFLFFAGAAFLATDPSHLKPWGSAALAAFSFACGLRTIYGFGFSSAYTRNTREQQLRS
jgi:hypothetical protein